ncbi:MAG: bifunctional oligoribonuclease/PAP phosphatase NrnA [Bacilli bacterium]
MYNEIYNAIEKYNNIVLARHIGVDPDAMCSAIALRDSIKKTFPNKKVIAVGSGSVKFNFIGKLDKEEKLDNALLIVLDTPDKRRVDCSDIDNYKYKIKIDHHPFIESFCDIELIDDESSSASEIVSELIKNTPLVMDKEIASNIFAGIVSDTNRFMFNSNKYKLFLNVSNLIKDYNIDVEAVYRDLFKRPLNEVRLQGYISQNMVLTENNVGYVIITDDVIKQYEVDSASGGNMINNFNNIEEVLVWLTISEDIKNDMIRISIRSRGPVINTVAEKYNGGGHKFASGARVKTIEEALNLVKDLDLTCKEYKEKNN